MTDHGFEGELVGRVAVVTGSGGAMGAAMAIRLAELGASVAINDRIPGATDSVESTIRLIGGSVLAVTSSVSRSAGAAQLIEAAQRELGPVDILVNNVGGIKGPIDNPIWKMAEEDWDATIGVNLKGMFLCTRLVVGSMMERREGKIVNVSSISWGGHPVNPAYVSAKAAVVAFTRSVAISLGPYNVNVNAVAPGVTRTGVLERMEDLDGSAWAPDSVSIQNPLGRINEPSDVADAVAFLVSRASRNISGQLITVAGGLNSSL